MSVTKAQAIVNGVTINLTYSSSTGKWEGTGTAPAKSSYGQTNHYYGVTLKKSGAGYHDHKPDLRSADHQ